MTNEPKERLIVEPVPGCEPEIGLLLGMLEETRGRTKERLAVLPDDELEWTPEPGFNSIGTILYHLALIEADWLYAEALEQAYPPEFTALFPDDVRDDAGRLTAVRPESLQEYVDRLDAVRAMLLAALRGMTLAEFRRVRELPAYDVTPEYVLHHLIQHEAEHRGEIGMLRALAARREGAKSP
jgi:uncharacterized damage-inducible protein DinB